jgi:tetratricopeptide (TPR) repeat protein
MGGKKSKENVVTSSVDTRTTTTAVSNINRRQRIAQNFLLVWVDNNIDESKEDCRNTLLQLRTIVNDVHIFTQSDQCIQFLDDVEDEKVFVIVSGSLGQQFVPDIHALSQVDSIYIFCANKSRHEQWTKEWVKIKGVHTDIELICESLQLAAKQCNEDSIAVSFVTETEKVSNQSLNQLEPTFMYTQIFKEILLEMEHDEQCIKQLADYCRKFYDGNTCQLTIIDEFEHSYRSKSAIWWYTRECFTYDMLNRALRTLEADTIINMGFFIRDLHQEIEELHRNQVGKYHGKPFIVYRGQGLSKFDFDKLQKTKGGLISFNNFLSTSKKREVSLIFAKYALTKTNMIGILFKMSIDPSVSSTPFAAIQKVSFINTEKEILFSMHTVFRINEIKLIDTSSTLYQVDLTLTADDDQQLRALSERIRQEVVGETGWKRLGQLLIKLSHFDKAEELYNILLEQTNDESKKASYYNQLGCIKDGQGDYKKAIIYYEKAREIKEKILSSDNPSLATCYNNIAGVSFNMGDYSKALSFYKKALRIRQKSLSANHPDLAATYNNIGLVHYNLEDYSKALLFYEKALAIKEITLPPNHPSMATSYNNIAGVYYKMKDYFKALCFYGKDHEICQRTLPPNHPDMAASYNNIGLVYKSLGEHSKALSFYEKAFEIYHKTLPSNHSLLATAYNNIGLVFMNMEQYSKAFSHLECALKIFQSSLSADHPSIQNVQLNIKALKEKLSPK